MTPSELTELIRTNIREHGIFGQLGLEIQNINKCLNIDLLKSMNIINDSINLSNNLDSLEDVNEMAWLILGGCRELEDTFEAD
jgi:hypothetical protein